MFAQRIQRGRFESLEDRALLTGDLAANLANAGSLLGSQSVGAVIGSQIAGNTSGTGANAGVGLAGSLLNGNLTSGLTGGVSTALNGLHLGNINLSSVTSQLPKVNSLLDNLVSDVSNVANGLVYKVNTLASDVTGSVGLNLNSTLGGLLNASVSGSGGASASTGVHVGNIDLSKVTNIVDSIFAKLESTLSTVQSNVNSLEAKVDNLLSNLDIGATTTANSGTGSSTSGSGSTTANVGTQAGASVSTSDDMSNDNSAVASGIAAQTGGSMSANVPGTATDANTSGDASIATDLSRTSADGRFMANVLA